MIHKNIYIFAVCSIFHQLFPGESDHQTLLLALSINLPSHLLREPKEEQPISHDASEKPLGELLENSNAEFFSALAQTFNQESSPPVERFAKQILKHASSKPNDNCQDDDEEYCLLTTIGEETEHKHNLRCQICEFRIYAD